MSNTQSTDDFTDEMNDLTLGLNKEKECKDFYARSAQEVTDARIQALYKWFVRLTEKRIDLLEGIRHSAAESRVWDSGMDDKARAIDETLGEAPALENQSHAKPVATEILTLRKGIELEKQAASISYTAARRSREANIRSLWRYLAPTEGRHKEVLESYFGDLIAAATKNR